MWRRQLPAYSPLPVEAILAGAAGLLSGAGAARSAVATALTRSFGAGGILLTNSGTGALTVAIGASLADIGSGSVALPAYGCYDLATAAVGAGAPVLLYDLDPATLAPDVPSLCRALERGARAVVLVHPYGVPVDPAPVRQAAEIAGARLIEDAAQGAGAHLRGRPLGALGDLAVLSFGRGKGNTAGRGGALLAHGSGGTAVLARARAKVAPAGRGLREFVQLNAQWLLGRPSLYVIPASLPFLNLGETVYHPPSPVRGLSAVAIRTLATTWQRGEHEASVRRRHAERLLAQSGSGLTPVPVPAGSGAGYLRLPFVASPSARAAAEAAGARALGIMPGYPRALCDLPGFGERILNRGDEFPGARLLSRRLITLPVHSRLTERDLAALEAWVAAAA
jgi:perosamine synthetase